MHCIHLLHLHTFSLSFSYKDDVPTRYYYGTHYSSAMSVASYLIRMEPFTQYFIKLQVCTGYLYNVWFFVVQQTSTL